MLLNGSAELALPWAAVDALEEADDGTLITKTQQYQ